MPYFHVVEGVVQEGKGASGSLNIRYHETKITPAAAHFLNTISALNAKFKNARTAS